MNTIMLFSGDDKLFRDNGFVYPKNLTEINGIPLIENTLRCFSDILDSSDSIYITINQQESGKYHTSSVARLINNNISVIETPGLTKGAACTVLLASPYIDNDEELTVINGDIIVEQSLLPALEYFRERDFDGGAVTFESVHPRWSFVKCDTNGYIIEAAEKRPISKNATAGFYYFKKGSDYVEAAKNMIRKDACVNGSFYICPVFNELILMNKRLGIYNIDKNNYFSLATPTGVDLYIKHLEDS